MQQFNPFYSVPPMEVINRINKSTEKKILRARSNWLGAFFLFSFALQLIFVLLWGLIAGRLGVEGDLSSYVSSFEYTFYSPLILLLPMFICAKASKIKITEIMPFEKCGFSLGFALFLFGFGGIFLGSLVADLVYYFFPATGYVFDMINTSSPETAGEYLAEILSTAAVPALIEEIVFRGIALGMLRRYGDRFAIVVSALLFALVHANFLQIGLAVPAGLFLGYLVVRSGSLWPAIALHFANNFIATVQNVLYDLFSMAFYPLLQNETAVSFAFSIALYVFYAVIFIIGCVLLRKHSKKHGARPLCKGTVTCLTTAEKWRIHLLSPALIIGVGWYIVQAVILLSPITLTV